MSRGGGWHLFTDTKRRHIGEGLGSFHISNGTDMSSRNVGKQLPKAAWHPRRATASTIAQRKPEISQFNFVITLILL